MIRILLAAVSVSAIAGSASAAIVVAGGSPGTTGVSGLYATSLLENTTGQPDSVFTGAPDGVNPAGGYYGVADNRVTYDLGGYRVIDGAGADFNLYEVDFGVVEPFRAEILVSADGMTFVSVDASRTAKVDIAGDEDHGDAAYAYGYDLAGSGLSSARYVRVQGIFSGGGAVNQRGFDLDSFGAANFAAVPEPGTWALMIGGLGLVGSALRRRAAVTA